MTPRLRYAFSEAWAVARSGPSRTLLAIVLIAIALYVPALVLTVAAGANARAIAQELARDLRVENVRLVSPEAARARFVRTYPDLAPALAELGNIAFPTSLE